MPAYTRTLPDRTLLELSSETILRELVLHWDRYGPSCGFTAIIDQARDLVRKGW